MGLAKRNSDDLIQRLEDAGLKPDSVEVVDDGVDPENPKIKRECVCVRVGTEVAALEDDGYWEIDNGNGVSGGKYPSGAGAFVLRAAGRAKK